MCALVYCVNCMKLCKVESLMDIPPSLGGTDIAKMPASIKEWLTARGADEWLNKSGRNLKPAVE